MRVRRRRIQADVRSHGVGAEWPLKRDWMTSVAVVTSDGRVVAAAGDEGAESEGTQTQRLPLPDGGHLIVRAVPSESAWYRFARAFIHEARSPLNALAIYIEL